MNQNTTAMNAQLLHIICTIHGCLYPPLIELPPTKVEHCLHMNTCLPSQIMEYTSDLIILGYVPLFYREMILGI